MPVYIQHRVNKISDLSQVDKDCGVEIDLRSDVSRSAEIHLSHDPWVRGDSFTDWLNEFKSLKIRGPLILNTKEDGLESRILEMLSKANIENYFFLDTTLPTLVKFAIKHKNSKFAVRVSSYESVQAAQSFKGKVDWVWVDCFDGLPLSPEEIKPLKSDFKMCLVSPELQGKSLESISKFKSLVAHVDAICTKSPLSWSRFDQN